ncbi:rhomboid family intramembrane serine protease [Pseudothioclava nitratireducens]|jgi:membrane associated rhomboid family serine protease|uniref:rhomboid family intramembrane serine protease n=1 Tax=Pseudothioclava nitratireducens TaxID=1928646 RepID=UPI0023DB80D5|nr:rhomboid family intramembrane serine protease [Defluviimonas nitratireducens]MDF1619008.1 rhomboid family intramembrane serine protease [Defluviimonas nitratireducens]
MREGYDEHPINPLPPVVWLLVAPVVIGEILFAIGGQGLAGEMSRGWRLDALQRFAFDPTILRTMIEQGIYPWRHVARIVTYPFVHGSFTHSLMVIVFILALGKMVAEIFRPWAVLAVFFGASILGALAHTAVGFEAALYGGYPAVYGLVGAFTWILWTRLGQENANQMRAFSLIGFLLGIQLVFSLIFGARSDWLAEVVGAASGFFISFLVAPGGWRRALARIRRR